MSIKENSLDDAFSHVNNVMFPFLIIICLMKYADNAELIAFDFILMLLILAIIRLRTLTFNKTTNLYKVILPIFVSFFVACTMYNVSCDNFSFDKDNLLNYNFISIILLLICNHLFVIRGKNKYTIASGYISTMVVCLIICGIFVTSDGFYTVLPFVSGILITIYSTYMIYLATRKRYKMMSLIVQVISTFIVSMSFVNLFASYLDYKDALIIATILNMMLSFLQKNELKEMGVYNTEYYILLTSLALLSVSSACNHSVVYNLFIVIVLIAYRYLSKVVENYSYVFNYIFVCVIFVNLLCVLLTYTSILISGIILLLGLLIAAYYINSDKYSPFLIVILGYIPYYIIVNNFITSDVLLTILTRLPLIFIVFVISNRLITMNKVGRFVFEILFISVIFLTYIFNDNFDLGLFTFVVSLIFIFVGFRKEKFISLFYAGIGIFIVNIIVQLSEYWSSIPIYVYLLANGLLIVGYVT